MSDESLDDLEVYVAMRMPWPDGSGGPVVLGVFLEDDYAAAACWRDQKRTGDQPTEVFLRFMNDTDLPGEGNEKEPWDVG